MSDPNALPPASPFFHPSVAISVTERGTTTPHGKHHRTRSLLKPDVQEHKSGLLGCAANMGVACVGSGIVGLPYAIKQAGFVSGVCLIFLTAVLTEKSLRLLVETAKHLHKQSYETAAEVTFGVVGFRFVLINMFIMSYGAMVTYLMITKDCASILLSVSDPNDQQLVLLAISLCVQLPLACQRDMADLEKTSALAVAIDCIIVGLVAYSSPWTQGVEDNGGWLELIKNDTVHYDSIFMGLGVLSFAFECQESAFLVAGSLKNPTAKRWGTVTSLIMSLCAALALIIGISGYFGYFDHVKGNILNNLDPSLATTLAAQAMLGLTMLATYPLASFVARHVCVVLLFEGYRAHRGDDTAILNRFDRRVLLTTVLYALSMIPATVFSDVGKVLALAGVVGASCLAYIGPGMLYLSVHGGRFLELVEGWFYTCPRTTSDKEELPTSSVSSSPLETTPLVSQADESAGGRTKIDGFLKKVLWYLGGFPLWCRIAEEGRVRVLAYAETLAEQKTINQLRIGDVDTKGIESLIDNGHHDQHQHRHHYHHQHNLSDLPPHHHIRQMSEGDAAAGMESAVYFNKEGIVLKPNPAEKLPKVPMLEADPQEDPPACTDFFIAIFYVVFGVIALIAGLISLADSGEGGDDSSEAVVNV